MGSFARGLGGIDFVLGVGDNFYPNGIKKGGAKSPQFKHNFEEVYTEKELLCPWYQLGGNHDHVGDISAQLAYHHLSPRWNFPHYWYTYSWSSKAKSGKTVTSQFVVIDTSILFGIEDDDEETGEIVSVSPSSLAYLRDDQLKWLDETLSASTADYLWVAGHYPIYGPDGFGSHKYNALVPMFKKYHVSGYLAGHLHTMEHYETSGADSPSPVYVISGCGKECNRRDTANNHSVWGPDVSNTYAITSKSNKVDSAFVSMVASESETTIQYVDDKGKILYKAKSVGPRNALVASVV